MKTRAIVRAIVCLGFLLGCLALQGCKDSGKEAAAVAAAQTWLALADAGQYAESWDGAASFFKGAVTREQWVSSLQAVRALLGNMLSRTVKSSTYTKSVPGAPDGEYVIIQFSTSFANKQSAVETVTPMLDKDGKWRVSGYFVK